MASNIDNTSTFRAIALLALFLLIAAAGLIYLQSGGGSPVAPRLAALSQAIPMQAGRALGGDSAAFTELDESLEALKALRQSGAPGRSSDWQQLETRGALILAKRSEVDATLAAASRMETDATALVQLANELLDRSSSTAAMQEFQQRADRIRETSSNVLEGGQSAAGAIAEDVGYLRNVANALGGSPTDLDIRPLNNQDREIALVPVMSSLTSLEEQSTILGDSIGGLSDVLQAQAELTATAGVLLESFESGGASSVLPGFLKNTWIPVGLIGVAILLLVVLLFLHSKSSVFERTAREQAEQNDRNQQAILRLLDEMGSLADGDLTVEATVTEDITGTIADSFNFAIEELRKLVATVNDTALMVDTATKQTENTAAHLAKAADNQAKEINAATAAVVSMASSIEEVSGNAERSSDVARHSVEVAHKGGEAVRRTIDGMNAIRETIQETSKRIKRLGESSQEIGNIVELINDIAEQTNILALNASIQASMAGEAGRGFAVVADEVQRLAERSTNATKQIEVLVRTIQADTNEAVVSMERSTTDVVGGALLAENAGAALDEIEQVSNQIASLVQNISSSARQQASSAADVTRRTSRLREISAQTGQATAATAKSISKLSELATQLRKTVEGFTLPADMMHSSALTRSSANVQTQVPAQSAANDSAKAS